MPTVVFTQNLRRHVNLERIDVDGDGDSVSDVLARVFEQYPRLRSYLLDDTGAVRKHVVLLINGESITDRTHLSDPVPSDAKVFVVQALSGG